MSTQRVSSVKIPIFDKENYGLWKKKMMLFLPVANPKYLGVLKNGPKIPMVIVAESIENNIVVITARTYPKDPVEANSFTVHRTNTIRRWVARPT